MKVCVVFCLRVHGESVRQKDRLKDRVWHPISQDHHYALCAVRYCFDAFLLKKKKKKRFDDSLAIWGTGTPSQFPLVRSSAQDKGIAFCDFAIRHVPESPKTSSYNCITNAISLTKICWFSNVNKNLPNCSPVLGNCDIRHEMNGVNKMKVVISLS